MSGGIFRYGLAFLLFVPAVVVLYATGVIVW